ncbi:MAG: M48 family metalloprotease [Micavibrio sp.]
MVMIKNRLRAGALAFVLILAVAAPLAFAQGAPTLIRDTEIEAILKEWTAPLIAAAGMDPDSVNLIVVQDNEVNAFVAGGANIFLYTGLIEKTKNPGELIGVIAHELGHIRGGHLVRTREALENASYESILGAVLGIGAAILTGDSGAAAAVSMGAQSQAMRRFLAFSRVQESSADQSALDEFKHAQMNPQGFLTFMEQLESQELLPSSQQAEYVRSHPVTRDRIDAIRRGVEQSPHISKDFPPVWVDQHKRMQAKLTGFIAPGKVAWVYDDRDQSLPARYARTIAAYRQNHVDEALRMADDLLQSEPANPYFHEIKGQMLMDFGRLDPAEISLRKAVELKPDAALIRVLYAHVLIENSRAGQNKGDVNEAISQLSRARQDETRSPRIHRLLATAYGYLGQEPEAQLHLAEEAVLQQRYSDAKRLAESASARLASGSRSWLRAQDILAYITTVDKDKVKDGKDRG